LGWHLSEQDVRVNRTLNPLFLALLFAVSACGNACPDIDEDALKCTEDAECDDGLYCNGFETCRPDHPYASRYGCVPGERCAARTTIEPGGQVTCRYREDEERIAECFDDGGDAESCCDATCTQDIDCYDGNFCNGDELCDPYSPMSDSRGCVPAREEPCTGEAGCNEDDDVCIAACEDLDGDGYGAISCGGNDCDDSDASISPGAPEICDVDGVDEDCDPTTYGFDQDGDGFISLDCCNGDDCGDDCDDLSPGAFPGGTEVCNGIDDDCDGDIDEMVRQAFYADLDGDGFGDA
jgi:hypothetical protein